MISVFIVEDEPHILETTREMVLELGYNVVGTASTLDAAFEKISSTKPDLVLLDVEIGNATSFDLLDRFERIDFKIIFITAHQKYALNAFRFSAMDFLLKPLSFSALELALQKVASLLTESQESSLDTLQHNLHASNQDQKIILKTQEKIEILRLEEIVHCESDLSYTIFHTALQRIMISKTMGYYEELLEPYGFFRIHKSHLINLSHVLRIHKTEGGEAELSTGARVPISQRRKEEFLRLVDQQGLS